MTYAAALVLGSAELPIAHFSNKRLMLRPRKPRLLLDEIFDPLILVAAQLKFALGMYARVMITANPQDDPYLRGWKVARDATWLLLLVGAYLQYYYLDVFEQIAELHSLKVRV